MADDKWIINTIQKRNELGLEELINKYGGLLKAIIQKHLYALPGHQDECLNDVFLAVWNNIEQYDPSKASFKNWIAVIAKYRSINTLKKYRNELKTVGWEEHLETQHVHNDKPLSEELWEIQLEELLAPLNGKDRILFKDIFESKDSTEVIAEKHDLTTGALYSRFSRGKLKIRRHFEKKGESRNE